MKIYLKYLVYIQGRSESLLHPKTSQPIHFICTSLDATGETCTLSNEDDLKKQCQKEAMQILDTILSYGLPKCWNTKSAVSGKQMTNVSWSDIAVVLPSRMQVNSPISQFLLVYVCLPNMFLINNITL